MPANAPPQASTTPPLRLPLTSGHAAVLPSPIPGIDAALIAAAFMDMTVGMARYMIAASRTHDG